MKSTPDDILAEYRRNQPDLAPLVERQLREQAARERPPQPERAPTGEALPAGKVGAARAKGRDIHVWVYGEPKGQPRPRACVRNGRASVYDSGTAEGWKGLIALAVREHVPASPPEGPVSLRVQFAMPRPKSHYRKDGSIKPGRPWMHTSKPDGDNLVKAVMDVLSQVGAWRDDAQVFHHNVIKRYVEEDERPGASLLVQYVPDDSPTPDAKESK